MKKDKKKYNLKVDEDQLEAIMEALELQSRLYIGQLEVNKMPPLLESIWKNDVSQNEKQDINDHLNSVKKIIWDLPSFTSSRQVDKDKKGDYSYNLYKQMRHHLENDKKEIKGKDYSTNVHSHTPLGLNDENELFIETCDKKVVRREKLQKLEDDKEIT
jgi:hypothetical protein